MADLKAWVAGIGASVLVHLGGYGLYLATNEIKETPDQPVGQSRLQLDTVSAKTQDAEAQTPETENADSAEVNSAALGEGAIRQSSATALDAPTASANAVSPKTNTVQEAAQKTNVLAATNPETDGLAQSLASGQTVSARDPAPKIADAIQPQPGKALVSEAPRADSLSNATLDTNVVPSVPTQTTPTPESAAPVSSLAAVSATSNVIVAANSDPIVVAQASTLPSLRAAAPIPSASKLGAATPSALAVAQSAPDAAPAEQAPTQGTDAATADTNAITPNQPPLPARAAKANLAWQFGDRLVTDPQALATIQAFMAPNAIEGAAEVKDGLSDVLTGIDCARLSATFIPETGVLEMRGHIPDPSLRDTILSTMQAQIGTGIPVTTNLLHLPAPQCGALTGIADIGLPQSTDQFTNQRLVGANAHAAEFPYTEGAKFQFEFTAPEYDAFVYVDYFDADGKVVHLQPNLTGIDGLQLANSVVAVNPKQPGTDDPIVIGPPYGQEIAVAFAASEKLYQTPRPIIEDAAPYLEWLKDQVNEARDRNPEFKGEWVYFFITTRPASQ